jgi:4-amino-4-deoxy-L-arabinose transferase-like glycosyltransferase
MAHRKKASRKQTHLKSARTQTSASAVATPPDLSAGPGVVAAPAPAWAIAPRWSATAFWVPLLAIWLVAVASRVIPLLPGRVVWGDEPFYLWLGRNWITGQGFSFTGQPDVHHGPLFPWLAGLLYAVTGNLEVASDILYVLFGSLLIFPVYAIGVEIYGRRTGLGAAALTALFPALTAAVLHWGSLTEPIYMLFVYLGLWGVLRVLRPCWSPMERVQGQACEYPDPWWAYGLAGLSFGLAYLTRPEAFTYFLLMGLFALILRLVRRGITIAFVGKIAIYLAAFALAFLPYAYYTYLNTGAWMVSEKVGVAYLTGIGLAHGDTAAFDRSTWGLDSTGLETFFFSSESYQVSMVDLILGDPWTFGTVLYLNIIRFIQVLFDNALFPVLLFPFVVVGLLAQGWSRERTLKEVFLVVSMLPVVSFVLFFIQARYIVPLIPVFILWTVQGVLWLGDWLVGTVMALRQSSARDIPVRAGEVRARSSRERDVAPTPYRSISKGWRTVWEYGPLALVLVGLVALHPIVVEQVLDVGSVRMEHKTVGQFLDGIAAHDDVIMARYPAIAFHADTRWVPTPNATWPEVLRYARHKGVRYFAIDERELRYRPQFQDLLTEETLPAELELAYASDAGDERLVVYELLAEPQ